MSLSDALLFDPAPYEVFLAIRPLAFKGSGTQADPWNCASIPYPEVTITSLTRSGAVATAMTNGNHGFSNGDMVTIANVQRRETPGAPSTDIYYAGTFAIYDVTATQFKYDMIGTPTNSPALPNIGSYVKCWPEREQFDVIMRMLGEQSDASGAGMLIRLGAGTFETKGWNQGIIGHVIPVAGDRLGSWQMRTHWRLVGGGIGVTTLKLVNCVFAELPYFAVGHTYNVLESSSVEEMTVDCNIGGQPNPQVSCAAILMIGSNLRVRRVRVINFSSQTKFYIENFVVALGAISPNSAPTVLGALDGGYNAVIEDCIAERPGANPFNNSTIFHINGGSDRPNDGVDAYARGCGIRNCFVNGEVIYGSATPVPIANISRTGDLVTVETSVPHLLTVPGNAVLRGVVLSSGTGENLFDGLFKIEALDTTNPATRFTFRLGTSQVPVSNTGFVGGGVSSHRVNIKSITAHPTISNRFIVETWDRHFRTENNNVKVYNVQKLVLDPVTGQYNVVPASGYDGTFPVDAYDASNPYQFEYTPEDPETGVELWLGGAFVSPGHSALSCDGGTALVTERNSIYHCDLGGPYHDTWAAKDSVARRNYYHDVITGPFQNFNGSTGGIGNSNVPNPFSLDGSGVPTTEFPHGLRAGDNVTISPSGDRVLVLSTPSPMKFTQSGGSGTGFITYDTRNVPFGGGVIPVTIVGLIRLGSLKRVTRGSRLFAQAVTSFDRHGLTVGDPIFVNKAGLFDFTQGYPEPTTVSYNGVFRVTAVIDEKTFEYELPSDPLGDSNSTDFSAGYFCRIWQVKRLMVERNVIELALLTFGYHPVGLPMYGGQPFPPEFMLRELVLRRNWVRNVNSLSAPSNTGIEVLGCETALVERNVLDIDAPSPIKHGVVRGVTTFRNITPQGKLIRSVGDPSYGSSREIIRDEIDEAVIWSLVGNRS